MPTIKNLTATLTLDGHPRPLTEHGTTTEGPDYASTYIIPGDHERFSITVEGPYIHPSFDIAVWIDGVYQDGRIMQGTSGRFREKFTGKEERVRGRLVKKLWKFGGLDVVDERGGCEEGMNVLLGLGTIEIVVLRCRGSGDGDGVDEDAPPHPRAKPYWNDWEADQNPAKKRTQKPILESHLKGRDLRHRVMTEKEFHVRRKSKLKTVEYLDSFENPFCILVFEYRSRDALENMDIIPREEGSEEEDEEEDEEEEEEEEVDRVGEIERLEALSREEILRELIAVKKLRAEKDRVRIKQEQREEWEEEREQGRARKRTKVKNEVVEAGDTIVVDLTDD